MPTYEETNYQQDHNQYSKPPMNRQAQQPPQRQQEYSRQQQPKGGNQF